LFNGLSFGISRVGTAWLIFWTHPTPSLLVERGSEEEKIKVYKPSLPLAGERVDKRSDVGVSRIAGRRVDSPPSPLSATQRGGVKRKNNKISNPLLPLAGERVVERSDDRVS